MITYLLKSGLLLIVFFAVYKLLLENEKMFRFNRVYLLASLIFSLIIPLQLFSIEPLFSTKIKAVQLDEIMIVTNKTMLNEISLSGILTFLLSVVYGVIVLILFVRFAINVSSFYRKMKKNKIEFIKGERVVLMKESILPHSFWNAIFINEKDFKNGKIPSELIAHEKAHLNQKHTLDILFVEVLQIVFWFNPLFVLFEKAIKLNHEFLADEAVNKQFGEIKNYQNLLLDFVSQKNTVALASNINYLITKKRLIMMTKKESTIKSAFKVLAVFAVCIVLLFAFSTETVAQEVAKEKDFKNVTDVGVQPSFPGGIVEFYKFVGQNYKMPEEVIKQKLNGKVYVQFMIETDGSLTGIKVLRDKLGYGSGEEAVRVLKLSPKWTPAYDQGKPVRVMYSLPIKVQAAK
ncbi:M56 family metallopeptidase [Flavobacterium sp. SH_e]|uniref:M56 family metallopeptidase n=1 Tax=Flavobacterium sp. SH_e TaxID=2983767 RepID=UPI0021E48BDC|nr:M56 family metallopeptidase [Flavobacterium sp. SH_e]MCV2485969.1 M56 family metallopeptidase [Flavobacterium sp. SH_e]